MVTADGANRRASAPVRPESISGRMPPQDMDAERGLLGSIFLVNDVLDFVADAFDAEFFYLDAHQKIYRVLLEMRGRGVPGDPVTVSNELQARGQLEGVGGDEYLMRLCDSVPHAAHAKYYAEIVREKFLRRSVIHSALDSIAQAFDPLVEIDELLSCSETRVHSVIERQTGGDEVSLQDVLVDVLQELDAKTVRRIKTHYVDFDNLTAGGLPQSGLTILAARPSVGKTSLACNIALNVAKAGDGVQFFSIEQSKLELAERLLCLVTEIPSHRLRDKELPESERDLILHGAQQLSEMPIYIDDRTPRTVSQIAAVSRLRVRQRGVRLIVVDYLQLIQAEDRRIPREQQVAEMSRGLKWIAKDLDVPVICLAQLNRQIENREDKRPRLADLRESGAIEQDADMVLFLDRPWEYDKEKPENEANVIVAKHRNGRKDDVKLQWSAETMSFRNLAKSWQGLGEGWENGPPSRKDNYGFDFGG